MSEQLIEQITGESENLVLHVELCQQRYLQLLSKFDIVELRLAGVGDTLREIQHKLNDTKTSTLETYLKWAGIVIMTFGGVITGLFMHVFTK